MPHRPRFPATALLTLLLIQSSVPVAAQKPDSPLSAPEDFAKAFASVPCEDKDRLAAVRALYEGMGATTSDIAMDSHEHVENLVVTKPGASAEEPQPELTILSWSN